MKNYFYRIASATSPTKSLCSGSVRDENMDAALLAVIKRNKITVKNEYYDEDSALAGCLWRCNFVNEGGKKVNISLSPHADQYQKELNNFKEIIENDSNN